MHTAVTQRVKKYIAANNLMDLGGTYIATLSGGPDSVALLIMLVRLGYHVEAAHCNFHLRGKESDRDENFCRDLCTRMQIPLHVVHFDTFGYAAEHKVSIEMAARELRYDYFEKLRKELNADGICVAHHINDTVETVIMNLVRGTGIRGLKGISARNGYILRPLLCITRNDIEQFLADKHQDYVTDSSNLVNDVTRNRIRLDIIPMLEQINSSAVLNMARTAHRVDEAVKVFDAAMKQTIAKVRTAEGEYDVKRILKTVSPEYTLFTILEEYGFTPAQIEDIYANLQAQSGTTYTSATHTIVFDRGKMLVKENHEEVSAAIQIPDAEGTYNYSDKLTFTVATQQVTSDYKVKKQKNVASLDAAKVKFPLTVRRVQTGDRFVPFGMKGSKLLSDYMTDRKMSLFKKQQQTVLTDADGNILWVVNERPDGRFCVSKNTEKVIEIIVNK